MIGFINASLMYKRFAEEEESLPTNSYLRNRMPCGKRQKRNFQKADRGEKWLKT